MWFKTNFMTLVFPACLMGPSLWLWCDCCAWSLCCWIRCCWWGGPLIRLTRGGYPLQYIHKSYPSIHHQVNNTPKSRWVPIPKYTKTSEEIEKAAVHPRISENQVVSGSLHKSSCGPHLGHDTMKQATRSESGLPGDSCGMILSRVGGLGHWAGFGPPNCSSNMSLGVYNLWESPALLYFPETALILDFMHKCGLLGSALRSSHDRTLAGLLRALKLVHKLLGTKNYMLQLLNLHQTSWITNFGLKCKLIELQIAWLLVKWAPPKDY